MIATLGPPSPTTTLFVLLGASEYPRKSSWSNPVLEASAADVRDYVVSRYGLALATDQLLDLFNSSADAEGQLSAIEDFLTVRGRAAYDLILYYIGHGGFEHREYYLGIRRTEEGREDVTTIESRKLARRLREGFRHKRLYVIMDACFAASAVNDFQGDEAKAVARDMERNLPPHGTAILTAASKWDVTLAPRNERHTIFTGALLDALHRGIDNRIPRLSMYELCEEIRHLLRHRQRGDEGHPELHVPSQRDGDVSRLALFPNVAYARELEARGAGEAAAPPRERTAEPDTPSAVQESGTSPRRKLLYVAPAVVLAISSILVIARMTRTKPTGISPATIASFSPKFRSHPRFILSSSGQSVCDHDDNAIPEHEECLCGFRATTPESDWPAHETACSYAKNFCSFDCCPIGQQIDPKDFSNCIAITDKPIFGWFGLFPRHRINRQPFRWIALGATQCAVSISVDNNIVISDTFEGSVGNLEFGYTEGTITNEPARALWRNRSISAIGLCSNSFGTVQRNFSIPAATERLRVDRNKLCWSVFPYFVEPKAPRIASCVLDICKKPSSDSPRDMYPGPAPCASVEVEQVLRESSACLEIRSDIHDTDAFVTCSDIDTIDIDQYHVRIP